MALVIGIGGVSRSGKSTLARKLEKELAPKRVLLMDMDEYVFPENEVPQIKGHTDWEIPESIDYDRIIKLLKINGPAYDIIIVEGILAFANEELNNLYAVTVFMEISKATYLERRKRETRWGKDPEWYLKHVWESHLKYGVYLKADFIFSGEKEISDAQLEMVIQKIYPPNN